MKHTDPPKKLRKPTIKERQLVTKVLQGKSASTAYKETYNTNGKPQTIKTEAYRTLKKPPVESLLKQGLAKYDLNVDRALKVLDDALDAEKTDYVTGEVSPNLDLRLKASDRVLKLNGIHGENHIQGNTFLTFVNQAQDKYIDQD